MFFANLNYFFASADKIVKIHESRILLCVATATIMKTCFDILGIRTVEKM